MALWKNALVIIGLYAFIWQVWAKLEVSVEDRREVLLDEVAEIPCIYNTSGSSSSPMIQWFAKTVGGNRVRIHYKDDIEEVEVPGTFLSGRIRVSYSQEGMMGNSILTINAVRVRDEQYFICQVNMDGSSEEGYTQLLAFKPPSLPSIVGEPYAIVEESLSKIASCEVVNGFPAPNITWYKDRAPLHSSTDVNVQNRVTRNSNGLYSVYSELYHEVKKEDKDSYFYCEVIYFVPGAEKMIESNRINITVHYSTSEVTLFQESPQHLIKEGDKVELRCQGDGNPQPVKNFKFNNNTISSTEDMLILNNVTRLNSGIYECVCLDTTSFEVTSGTLNLMVHFMDPVVIMPENPESLDEGKDLSLTCNAVSSLTAHAAWYKDDVLIQESHVLRIQNASYATAGKYVCEVKVLELPELKRHNSVHIRVRGKPIITEGVTVIHLDTGRNFNVSCRATGYPTPVINWTLSDGEAQQGRWDITTENSILSIISINTTSDITASCMANNGMGVDKNSRLIKSIQTTTEITTTTTITSTTTTVTSNSTGTMVAETPNQKKIKKGSNGFIIAIIIIFILLLAILGSVLYFMYKKGRLPCGRSGKQDLTKEKASSDDIVVEMKNSKSEEAVLLQGINGDKKTSLDQ